MRASYECPGRAILYYSCVALSNIPCALVFWLSAGANGGAVVNCGNGAVVPSFRSQAKKPSQEAHNSPAHFAM